MFTLSPFPPFSVVCFQFSFQAFYIHRILKGKSCKRNYHQWKANALQVKPQLSFEATLHEFVTKFQKRKEVTSEKNWGQTFLPPPPPFKGECKEKKKGNQIWKKTGDKRSAPPPHPPSLLEVDVKRNRNFFEIAGT